MGIGEPRQTIARYSWPVRPTTESCGLAYVARDGNCHLSNSMARHTVVILAALLQLLLGYALWQDEANPSH